MCMMFDLFCMKTGPREFTRTYTLYPITTIYLSFAVTRRKNNMTGRRGGQTASRRRYGGRRDIGRAAGPFHMPIARLLSSTRWPVHSHKHRSTMAALPIVNSFLDWLGVELTAWSPDHAETQLAVTPKLVNR